jgi:maleate isomerase
MTGQNDLNASMDRPQDMAPNGEREYGRAGLFGIVTPPGNPTVEPEMRILLPAGTTMLVSRLIADVTPLRPKLVEYGERLGETIDRFAGLAFDSLGFACTGSSYLVDPDEERRRLDVLEAKKSYPIVTAAGAIAEALAWLGVRAVALVSPYPEWLTAASRAHWERIGLRVTNLLQLPSGPPQGGSPDSHRIYELTTPAVLGHVAAFDPMGADAILVSGTGMPSLRVILGLRAILAGRGPSTPPVLSSNLCLAWALAKRRGRAEAGPESPLYGGWEPRMELA